MLEQLRWGLQFAQAPHLHGEDPRAAKKLEFAERVCNGFIPWEGQDVDYLTEIHTLSSSEDSLYSAEDYLVIAACYAVDAVKNPNEPKYAELVTKYVFQGVAVAVSEFKEFSNPDGWWWPVVSPSSSPSGFDVWIDPGEASVEEIQQLFQSLSDLNRAHGGEGLVFNSPAEKVRILKDS